MLPFLRELEEKGQEKFPGLLDNLLLKSVKSDAKNFKNILFVDTPGLADGDLKYKFDVDAAIEWMGKYCDLILVFLDPCGQAMCKRTMNLVKRLYPSNLNKLHFYMTKGDVFDSEEDKVKCVCQITQGVTSYVPPMHGFQIPIIYMPNKARDSSKMN